MPGKTHDMAKGKVAAIYLASGWAFRCPGP